MSREDSSPHRGQPGTAEGGTGTQGAPKATAKGTAKGTVSFPAPKETALARSLLLPHKQPSQFGGGKSRAFCSPLWCSSKALHTGVPGEGTAGSLH